MIKKTIFTGSGVALITPFNNKGVDFMQLEKLIDWHIQEGTDALIVCGTTGEAPTLPMDEHKEVIRFTVEKVKGRIPVIAGAGSNDTAHAIGTSRFAQSVGVDGILSVAPYYNKTSEQGVYEHFKAIARAVDTPIILYNVPSRTVLNMSVSTVAKLSQIENIVGIKECDFNHVAEILHTCPDFDVYSGEDSNVLPLLSLGGKGVISVMANIIPHDTHRLCQAFFEGNLEESRRIQLGVTPLVKALFMEPNPVPTKVALNKMGYTVGGCRLPLVPMSPENELHLESVMKAYGLLK